MRRLTFALILAAAPLSVAQAQNMPVSQFLAKADALQKKGPMALLSSDIGLLKRELEASEKQLQAEQAAARKAGHRNASCFPEKVTIKSNELLQDFRSIPASRRNMSVKTAFRGFLLKKYPCPA